MATPGLMFVVSRVRDAQKTPDELYNRFYNEEHLAAVLAGGHVKLGLRYKNVVDTDTTIPYLALYPIDDASTIGSPESRKHMEETKKSKILECDDIFDLIHFELRPYEKIQTYEGYGHGNDDGQRRGRTMIYFGMEPGEGQNDDVDSWYRKQHLDMLAMCKGFIRCTRYKRKDGACPRFLALAEYDCDAADLPIEQMKQVRATEWSTKILNDAKVYERGVFSLIQAQGDTHLKL
ncbi:putative alpha beta [Rosellinia necatrix]|uniref:Putative alpha beta n=1 Tax=Rosellinia necatrix TaxID=77044 RepID=A0A1S8A5C9_ROSNE|nr:putative alpha beta [Rosellinia necatrix]